MKILIIGFGSIGQRHAANALLLGRVAVYEKDANQIGSTPLSKDIQFFSTLQEAFNWKPDGIIIATPHSTHIEIANKAIDSGGHVLIEKPISNKLNGVSELLKKASINSKKVFVVCNMRFHPGIKALKENLKHIGKPLFARSHVGNYLPNMRPGRDYRTLYCSSRKDGGGVIMDAIHEIDYLMNFFGKVEAISGVTAHLSNLEIDVEDYASLCLLHSNGVNSEIHLDYLRPFKRRGCEIVGTEGLMLWESEGKNPENCCVRLFRKESNKGETIFEDKNIDINKPYIELLEGFLDEIQGRRAGLLTGEEAFAELKVVTSAYQSSKYGKIIYL